jgi:hypothetical protein
MKILDITPLEFIKSVVEIEIYHGTFIDLHGESVCTSFFAHKGNVEFLFENNKFGKVSILFEKSKIIDQSGVFLPGCTMDDLYRGRVNDFDADQDKGLYFYISFIEDDFSLTIKANRILLSILGIH